MRIALLICLINLLSISTVCASIIDPYNTKDTTDLAAIVAPEDPDFINVVSQKLIKAYLESETEISCPGVVLVVYDEKGNKESVFSYSLVQFTRLLQQDSPFRPGRVYLILTRFRTYYFNNIKSQKP